MKEIEKVSVRAYGLWINEKNQVLVSDEIIDNKYLTKFPGGGLELGEGLIDCVKREWLEELNVEIEVNQHFYTTDFFQISVFNPNTQIISIYYLVKPLANPDLSQEEKVFTYEGVESIIQSFRFIDIHNLSEKDLTLPIDQKVALLLKKHCFNI
jgi:8-oxo-dGTP diphosphatase